MSNVREFDVSTSPRESVEPPKPPAENFLICDEQFMRDVGTLKDLRSFMLQQAAPLKASEGGKIFLGQLNLLRYDRSGRFPSLEEWKDLEDSRVLRAFDGTLQA